MWEGCGKDVERMWKGCGKDVERMWIPVQKGSVDNTKYNTIQYNTNTNIIIVALTP